MRDGVDDGLIGIARYRPEDRVRVLGDLGYDFRPGSYFHVPKDQGGVIHTGMRKRSPSVAWGRLNLSTRAVGAKLIVHRLDF